MTSDPAKDSALNRNRLQIACSIVDSYDGSEPFHHFLGRFFAANKGFGSTDRRLYRNWCYSFFRIGKALADHETVSRMTVANFIVNGCSGFPFQLTAHPEFAELKESSVRDRVKIMESVYPNFSMEDVFLFSAVLSDGIERKEWTSSLLKQPDVFIRVNRSKNQEVESDLKSADVPYRKLADQTYALSAGVSLQNLKSFRKNLFQVQDLSSQKAGEKIPVTDRQIWWDCCCGAGGKSLQLLDLHPQIRLTSSDKRESILKEFVKRLPATINASLDLKVIDIENDLIPFQKESFDGILADIPCSGSGTWGRTPESLSFFNSNDLQEYVVRQKNILQKVTPFLRQGGTLTYITCSVFREENEDIINWAEAHLNLRPVEASIVSGLENNSDSMFYAVLEKP